MDDSRPSTDYEIDLLEFFETLWNGKFKIIGFALVSLIIVFGYQKSQPPEDFLATTQIKPVGTIEVAKYSALNNLDFFTVDSKYLIQLYKEELENRKLFEDAIRKFNLLDRAKYKTEDEFNAAVISLASKIEILTPVSKDKQKVKEKSVANQYSSINFKFNDKNKWNEVLAYVTNTATNPVRENLQELFKVKVESGRLNQAFAKDEAILGVENAIEDYDSQMKNRIAFLKEQALIARKLKIDKNTLEAQALLPGTTLANMTIAPPFYFRGYEAIEKEISLIESRSNPMAFVPKIIALKSVVRKLEQDSTIEKAESLIALTPIFKGNFIAASVSVDSTKFNYESMRSVILLLAILFGSIIGSLYVLINRYKNKV